MRYYSHRILRLLVSCDVLEGETPPQHVVGSGILQAMHDFRQTTPQDGAICHKLRKLEWNETKWSSSEYMSIFLGPNVVAVEADLDHEASASTPVQQVAALAQIHSLSPNLISLIISDGGLDSDSTLAQELHTLALNLGKLEHITCWSIPWITNGAVLDKLARLPALKTIGMLCMEDSALLGIHLPSQPFCGLVEANISVASLEAASAFIRLVLTSPLKRLSVRSQGPPSLSAVREFFGVLKLSEHRLLTSIDVASTSSVPPEIGDEEPPRLDPIVLESLLEYTSLESVVIDPCLSMHDVDNDLLKRMADAWPALHQLGLGLFHGCRWPSKVTVEGLRAFRSCPNLDRVALALDATISTSPGDLPQSGGLCNTKLNTLDALHSTISNPRSLAAALMDMFPNLENIGAWDGYEEDDEHEIEQQRLWNECRECYKWFVAIRKLAKGKIFQSHTCSRCISTEAVDRFATLR